jgi:protein-disulfide isomerase
VASRAEQKARAKAERLAIAQQQADRDRRRRRLTQAGVVIGAAVVVVVIAIVVSSSSNKTPKPKITSATATTVSQLLAGIPQSGNRLGSPSAPVTVTEYGDLECPICQEFALGTETQLIRNDVRAGKVQLLFRSLQTATQDPSTFETQQAAALAAGSQQHMWDYVLLFYHQQGQEDTGYVTESYLDSLAQQIPRLNYNSWLSARNNSSLSSQVSADEQSAAASNFNSTPTLVIKGPKGSAQPIVGAVDYSTLEQSIKSVA